MLGQWLWLEESQVGGGRRQGRGRSRKNLAMDLTLWVKCSIILAEGVTAVSWAFDPCSVSARWRGGARVTTEGFGDRQGTPGAGGEEPAGARPFLAGGEK